MDYIKALKELQDYYANLLIIQYHNKPKATNTIKTTINKFMSDLIIFKIRDGFNILNEPYAVGKQLDIIGEWVGVDRLYDAGQPLYPWFSLIDWEQNTINNFQGGFQDWNDPIIDDGGIISFDDLVVGANKTELSDDLFLKLIKLKIIKNSSRHTMRDIDDKLFNLFGDTLYVTWGYDEQQLTSDEPKGMSMTFNYPKENIIFFKNYFY